MSDFLEMYDFSVVREFRKRAGLTLQALSGATGVSPAVISKLERNQTTAELGTLFKLGKAFGMGAAELLRLAEKRTSQLSRERVHQSGDLTFREVSYANCRLLLGQGVSGGRVSEPKVHRDDFEVCWTLSGVVRISLPNEKHVLKPGDCLQFDAILPHTYEVVEDCTMMVLHLRKDKRF